MSPRATAILWIVFGSLMGANYVFEAVHEGHRPYFLAALGFFIFGLGEAFRVMARARSGVAGRPGSPSRARIENILLWVGIAFAAAGIGLRWAT